jgi:hypothetical protein
MGKTIQGASFCLVQLPCQDIQEVMPIAEVYYCGIRRGSWQAGMGSGHGDEEHSDEEKHDP